MRFFSYALLLSVAVQCMGVATSDDQLAMNSQACSCNTRCDAHGDEDTTHVSITDEKEIMHDHMVL